MNRTESRNIQLQKNKSVNNALVDPNFIDVNTIALKDFTATPSTRHRNSSLHDNKRKIQKESKTPLWNNPQNPSMTHSASNRENKENSNKDGIEFQKEVSDVQDYSDTDFNLFDAVFLSLTPTVPSDTHQEKDQTKQPDQHKQNQTQDQLVLITLQKKSSQSTPLKEIIVTKSITSMPKINTSPLKRKFKLDQTPQISHCRSRSTGISTEFKIRKKPLENLTPILNRKSIKSCSEINQIVIEKVDSIQSCSDIEMDEDGDSIILDDVEESLEMSLNAFDEDFTNIGPTKIEKSPLFTPMTVSVDTNKELEENRSENQAIDSIFTPLNQEESISLQKFTGFSTGAGKHISVSRKSLDRAKSLFADTEDFEKVHESDHNFAESINEIIPKDFGGFKTSSGKDISVSEASKNRIRGIFGDIFDEDLSTPFQSNNNGFEKPLIFNNRAITEISKETTEKIRGIFGNIDTSNSEFPEITLKRSTPFTPLIKKTTYPQKQPDSFASTSSFSTPFTSKPKPFIPVLPSSIKRNLFETPLPQRVGLLRQSHISRTFTTPRKVNQTPQSTFKAFKIPLTPGFTPSASRQFQMTPMKITKPIRLCKISD